ncbi:class I SAM-dependent methyltransferase [Romeria aff. gracilis LEGE 07310]|uniref:Class I SAM-dependent methyltransferase n=1 Tax=Vasconcelosia minhoensis LEGE 07310 TaxID=915328 RepID=A0A8J7DSB1_9CYAN|nr:class I SAM-dependent methyltransferase [Romeria gracilis]MBE9079939.1 class I SAM-dependent methyltransferase [Romeria aff. gracilis LEGE 07310]
MIESSNPEINTSDLMERIRQEIRSCQPLGKNDDTYSGHFIKDASYNLNVLEEHLKTAEFFSQTPQKFPDKLAHFPFTLSKRFQGFFLRFYGFIFKKQRVVNASLIHSIRELAQFNQNAVSEIQQRFVAQIDAELEPFRELNQSIHHEFQEAIHRLHSQLEEKHSQLEEKILLADRLIIQLQQGIQVTQSQFSTFQKEQLSNNSYFKYDLMQQKRLTTFLLNKGCQGSEQAILQSETVDIDAEKERLLDSIYFAFEDKFRGSYEDILERLRYYITILEEAHIESLNSEVLDLGCGRGEWLEVMRDIGYSAKGVDANAVMVEICQSRGFDVQQDDALTCLKQLPSNHLAAVTGFHIIEHMSFPSFLDLVNEAIRVLKPGGMVIFETPNPRNLVVGACDFYCDPTHQKPLFPETMKYFLELAGFLKVDIHYLHPVEEIPFPQNLPEWKILSDFFYGPRDYAIIGYKLKD